jgi:hypothetical protein
MRLCLVACLIATMFSTAAGQEAISFDRDSPAPVKERFDLGDRITAVTQGRVQIEGGYVYTHDRVAGVGVSEHVLPDMLLRVGLTERLELRFGWPGYVSTHYDGPAGAYTIDQTLDPNVGFMLDLFPQQGWRPQTAVLASVPITLHGNPLTMSSMQPLTEILYCWYPGERWTVGGTTGFSLFDQNGDDYVQFQQSVNADYLVADRLGAFLEWTMLVDHGSADDGSQHLLGSGLTFLWTERIQVGWRVGVGLNTRAPDFLTGIRFAFRF